ncbi:helix-turn-helix transcriptional regulator [Microlunatus soli]|uniref:DNA-binding response regulator, NarL/FixJ family, contains REC and HTH domains n=1 Tax=Microlunatus soli TaxID=630515 RepID=A0A1H1WTM1_9ACTN|nr:response regulator transcription factor [Microlunatus soli]SDS99980.1 DNA-binding response regulator, NarL/FixJ family, contains REC and HTH domains [Microlunatus soli]
MTIKVALVNDYEVIVRGLANMLRNYTSKIDIVELDANREVSTPVDIVLYDTFGDIAGHRQINDLLANPAVRRVAVYVWNFGPIRAKDAIRRGASGYLSKRLPAAQLVDSLIQIHHGRTVVVDATPVGGRTAGSADWPGREEGLTEREAEMLALITRGLSNAEIADVTGLSPNSIKSYIRSCYRRIDVSNRANAVRWGVRHGFEPDHVRVVQPDVG